MAAPLAGTLVVDLGLNVSGPMAATVLGDLGARVVKVEPPAGDPMRAYPPAVDGVGALFSTVNRNKQLIGLDLRHRGADMVLERLLDRADVVIQNLRPGKARPLGVDAEACHARNPRIVHCSVEAFYPGSGGRPGYDLLVQAESGLMSLTGYPDGEPARLPGTIIDQVVGLWTGHAAVAQLCGPRDRATVEVSMMDVAVWLLTEKIGAYLATGETPVRMGSSTSITTPHGVYPTQDGYLVVGAATDELFRRLAGVVGAPSQDDPRFATQRDRLVHRQDLDDLLRKAFSQRPVRHWLRELDAVGIPVGEVRELPEAVRAHARASATGLRASADLEGLATVAPPVRLDGERWELESVPGPVGRDSTAVLRGLGVGDAEIGDLVAAGAVVSNEPCGVRFDAPPKT